MVDIFIKYDDIEFLNVVKEDLKNIYKSMILDRECIYKNICIDCIDERFLEYYISENEFCLKIKNKDNYIGLIKGRMEFTNTVEIWLNCFYIYIDYRNKGMGSKLLDIFEKEIKKEFLVEDIYSVIPCEELELLRFWNRNGYDVINNIKKDCDYKYNELIILKKKKGWDL